jgi:patatin-related protein
MAWNGGVSLAVWMAGAAVELDTARRAHLGIQRDGPHERRIYNVLTETFARELVIDIIAGASAGGINGALLAAAITRRRELRPDFLRARWMELGDLSMLLRPVNEAKPESLMRGDYFRQQVDRVFRALMGDQSEAWSAETSARQEGHLMTDVVLDVQTTNVIGQEHAFSDHWQQTLYAREYRAPLRFRLPADYTSDALTAAARASASFPAAFEPSPLTSKAAELGGFPGLKRWAIDGGLLENAPIRPAIELIPTRSAERPVARFLCYVNAAPSEAKKDDDDPATPNLRSVLADIVNLPREGRFIDQLTAIQDATRRTSGAVDVASGLLRLSRDSLRATATALFDAYCKPRRAQSLFELMSDFDDGGKVAGMVAAVEGRLGAEPLPWIPVNLDTPTRASEWRWGLRTAQRILLLQLDLARVTVEDKALEAPEADRAVARRQVAAELLEFRKPLNKLIARLEDARLRFSASHAIHDAARALAEAAIADPREGDGRAGEAPDEATNVPVSPRSGPRVNDGFLDRLADLDALMVGFRCEAFEAVYRGTEALHRAVTTGPLRDEIDPTILFGETAGDNFTEEHFRVFLERALCIEVVRRAFQPDRELETAQDMQFVQLTPLASVRVFETAPMRCEGPNNGRAKLTGLDLAHFSAFYRRSWRANDFMWGRLDAATRIVDLFVSASRLRYLEQFDGYGLKARLTRLVTELVPDENQDADAQRSRDLRQLVREALVDAWTPSDELAREVTEGLNACHPATDVDVDDVASLRDLLATAIVADLEAPHRAGFFTRVVCARAAQYEVVRQELEPLAEATAFDGKLGCFTKPIRYHAETSSLDAARSLVDDPKIPLPMKLGSRSQDEITSTLAVRTFALTALVVISSLRTAGVPLGWMFGFLRAPFLSLAGITAERARYRLVALLTFVAGSFYLTARAVAAQDEVAQLEDAWSPSTLAMITAGFGVLGLVLLPSWRAVRASSWARKIRQGAWAVAMVLASGLVALCVAFFAVGFGNALTSTDGFELSNKLAAAVIAVPVSTLVLIRYVRLPALVSGQVGKLATRVIVLAIATAIVAILLIRASLTELRTTIGVDAVLRGAVDLHNWRTLLNLLTSPTQLWEGIKQNWREVMVVCAYASVPLALLYGMHGFVRSIVDVTKVKGPTVLPTAYRWTRSHLPGGKTERNEPPETLPNLDSP